MRDRIEDGLKPCPFCGSKWIVAKYVNNPFDENHVYGGYAVYCDDCCCITNNFKTIEAAIEVWNRRVESTPPSVEVVRCKECRDYVPPEDGDFLGVCKNKHLCVSNCGEVYPEENYFCPYGKRK